MKITAIFLALVLLAGCSQVPPPREFVMRPLANSTEAAPNAGHGLTVVVTQARMPDYLDRADLPTPVGLSELRFDHTERWADRPSDNLSRVVAANLQAMLPGGVIMAVSSPTAETGVLMVTLDVSDMVLDDNGAAALKGRWSILNSDSRKLLRTELIDLRQPSGSADRISQIAAMNQNLLEVSRQIAAALHSLPKRA